MPAVELNAISVAQGLFWLLLPCVLLAPPKLALLAWLTMTNLDATGPGIAANANIGWINALKSLGLPLILGWRMRGYESRLWRTLPVRSWLLLIAYASIASVWSAYPLAAAKIVGNMIGILISVVILAKFARAGLIDARLICLFVLITLGIGTLQTAMYGGQTFGFDGADQAVRFTGFVGAQQYAALLVALFCVVLWFPGIPASPRLLLLSVLLIGLVINGSRTWFVGAVAALVIYAFVSFRRIVAYVVLVSAACFIPLMMLVWHGEDGMNWIRDTDSRLVATLHALSAGRDESNHIGLRNLTVRFALYGGLFDALNAAEIYEIVFGHGTSNAGNIAMAVFPRSYTAERLDPNRAVHNEWLRVQYEWGIVGSLLWGVTFWSLFAGAFVFYHRGARRKAFAAALLSYFPALSMALSSENVFAGAGNAVTIGFSLLLACLSCTVGARPRPVDSARRILLA